MDIKMINVITLAYLGDAIYEVCSDSINVTPNSVWYNNYAWFPWGSGPFFTRGWYWGEKEKKAGIFAFSWNSGSRYTTNSFRVVVPVL